MNDVYLTEQLYASQLDENGELTLEVQKNPDAFQMELQASISANAHAGVQIRNQHDL